MTISVNFFYGDAGENEYLAKIMVRTLLAGASEASEETKHWRGMRLFVNNGLPLQCLFAQNLPTPLSAGVMYLHQNIYNISGTVSRNTIWVSFRLVRTVKLYSVFSKVLALGCRIFGLFDFWDMHSFWNHVMLIAQHRLFCSSICFHFVY